jgi:hypothetical protein
MTLSIHTHDAWGNVNVGEFLSLDEAKHAFEQLCNDPWYRNDGTVKGLELIQTDAAGSVERLAWHAFD